MKPLLCVVCCIVSGLPMTPAVADGRPNFLVIVADDLCWRDLGYEGNPDIKTPHLDRLRAESIHLQGMFSPAPLCSPCRHALYTGLYPIRSGAYPNHTRAHVGTKSIFTYLRDAGYRVALQNKAHIGPKPSFPYEHIEGADDLSLAAKFIERDPQQPWLLVFASDDPHAPWTRGPKYDPAELTVPPYLHDNAVTRTFLAAYYGEITQLDQQVGDLVKLLDTSGQADQTLVLFVSEQGSTFPYGGKANLSDNGIRASALARWPGHIQPGSESKALMQYVDVVPTFLEAAGIDLASVDSGCPDANGHAGLDGQSFLPVLRGQTESLRDHVFAQHTTVGVNEFIDPYPIRAVRDQRYKLILNLTPENTFSIGGIHTGEVMDSWRADAASDPDLAKRIEAFLHRPGEELYDLDHDPLETRNLADDPHLAGIKAELRQQLDAWMQQQGDRGLATEMLAPTRQNRAAPPKTPPRRKAAKAT
jgi:uncharacterized sulfatase